MNFRENKLITERKYRCYSKGNGGWFGGGGKCEHSGSVLSDSGRPGDCGSLSACKDGMVVADAEEGTKGNGKKTKQAREASKHLTMKESQLKTIKVTESELISTIEKIVNEQMLVPPTSSMVGGEQSGGMGDLTNHLTEEILIEYCKHSHRVGCPRACGTDKPVLKALHEWCKTGMDQRI